MNPHALAEQLITEHPVEFRMGGCSMYPTLRADDWAIVKRCEDATKIRPGDIVAFRSGENCLVCHRVVKIKNTNVGRIFISKGDNSVSYDQPFTADQIFGIIISYKHNDKKISINSLRMKFLRFAFLYFSWFAQKGYRVIGKMC